MKVCTRPSGAISNFSASWGYNVNIVERIEDGEEPLSFLQTAAYADDYAFDVIYGWGYKLGACVIEGLLGDISSLPHIDLTRDYWAPDACEDLMINNSVYMVPCDISMNRLDWTTFMSFNKRIVEDYNIVQDMGGKTFYELVNEGQWTIHKFLQAVQLISTDMDGNGTIDNTDVYGLIDASGTGEIYGFGCGIDLVKRNDDGSYLVSYCDENSINLATKINEIFTNKKFVKSYMDLMYSGDIPDGMDQFEYARSFFSNGHSLFITGSANTMNEFRDMEDEYGILPMPKFDESQENYISTVDSNAAMFAIPAKYRTDISSASPDRTGKVLEAMSKLSSKTVLPAYIDTIVKHGPSDTEHDLAMLDIIYNTTHYEFANMFREHTESITYAYSSMFSSPASSLSTFRAKSKVMQKALDDFYLDILAVEDKLAG